MPDIVKFLKTSFRESFGSSRNQMPWTVAAAAKGCQLKLNETIMAAAAKSSLSHFSVFLIHASNRLPLSSINLRPKKCSLLSLLKTRHLSSTPATPYPLQYDMIISRPSSSQNPRRLPSTRSKPTESSSDSDSSETNPSKELTQELSFEDWVDKKLTQGEAERMNKNKIDSNGDGDGGDLREMDKGMRKYYNKRKKRMYGSDSEDERRAREKEGFVELKNEVVELRTLHKREEELYFYDTFALPWEKDKHYKMVYQLEKKYFPDQCLDKAFLEPGQSNNSSGGERERGDRVAKGRNKAARRSDKGGEEDKGLVFFEEGSDDGLRKDDGGGKEISEKKVEEFFKCLKKVPNMNGDVSGSLEPFLASRSNGLPSEWDTPAGTVVLVNKPKGDRFIV